MSHDFKLEGADGEIHDYTVVKTHDPIVRGSKGVSGLRLVQKVARSAGTPIVNLLDTNIGTLFSFIQKKGAEGSSVTKGDILALFDADHMEDVQKTLHLTDAFDHFFDAVEQADLAHLLPDILYHTTRDGKPLKKDGVFNVAFTANYFEAVQAAYKVARINGFFGSLDTQLSRLMEG